MAGVEWQCHETEQLKSLFDDNKSLEEIVEASGRTRNAVGRKLRMLGLSFLARNKRNSRVGKKVLSGDGVIDCLSCHEPFISVWKATVTVTVFVVFVSVVMLAIWVLFMTDVTAMAKAVVTIMRRKTSPYILFLSNCSRGYKLLNERLVNVSHYDDLDFVGVYSPSVSRSRVERDLIFNIDHYFKFNGKSCG